MFFSKQGYIGLIRIPGMLNGIGWELDDEGRGFSAFMGLRRGGVRSNDAEYGF
jgi:hypothetical protein